MYTIRTLNKKLTLKLDGTVIESAKTYAAIHNESVSGLVEKYLRALTENILSTTEIKSKKIQSISGVIKLPENYDEKHDYREFRATK